MANQVKPDLPVEAQARVDFVRSVVPKRKTITVPRVATLLVILVVLVGLIWLVSSGGSKASKTGLSTKPQAPIATSLNTSVPTLSYSSKFFSMTLNYPKTWTLKDSGKGLLQITSPLTNLVSAGGQTQKGYVVLATVPTGQLPPELTSGTALAVLDSSLATYNSPSADQAGQTYVSFVQYSTTNVKGGLDAVYATGNFGYQKDQVISTSDIAGLNPLIYVSFNGCSNNLCTKQAPITIASASWSSTPLNQIVTNIIQSLVFN